MIFSRIARFIARRGKPARYASVYERGRKLFVAPRNRTRKGAFIDSEPVAIVEPGNAAQVAEAIHAALRNSRSGIPHPDFRTWSENGNPVRRAAGDISWEEFVAGTRHVSIIDDGGLRMVPYNNRGPDEGFVSIKAAEVVVRGDDVAAALREALDGATAS